MTIKEIARYGILRHLDQDQQLNGVYVGDLASDVLIHAPKGCLLVTMQAQPNMLAVAIACHIPAIVLSLCPDVDDELLALARGHHLSLITTPLDSYTFLKHVGVWI